MFCGETSVSSVLTEPGMTPVHSDIGLSLGNKVKNRVRVRN